MTNVTPIIDVNAAMIAAVKELQKQRTKWDSLQQKADGVLYKLMDGCLRLTRLCDDEGYALALKNIAQFKFSKKTPITVIIAKLVFGTDGKRAYAYAKALDKAVLLGLGKDSGETFATHLKLNGGVNALIRTKEADEFANGDDWGSYAHFGEMMLEEMSKNENIYKTQPFLEIDSPVEFRNSLSETNHIETFFYATFNRDGSKLRLNPLIVNAHCSEFKRMFAIYTKFIGSDTAKNEPKTWEKYLTKVALRQKRLDDEKEAKQRQIAAELEAIKDIAA